MTAWAQSLIRISNYEVETLQKRLAEITSRKASAEMRLAVLDAEVEIEREDHDPADDMPEPAPRGVVGAARRFVGQLMETRAPSPAPAGMASLSRDDIRRLEDTLAELLDCKRILDSAR